MAGLFDLLNTVIGKITQNSVTYATAPTPPSGDDSTKVATTAFVADKTAAISSGNVAVWSRDFTHSFTGGRNNWTIHLYAPKGGTWFCWGEYNPYYVSIYSGKITIDGLVSAGGSEISSSHSDEYDSSLFEMHNHMMAIKIA